MKNELIEQAQQTLWSRDFLGYSFEMNNIEVLKRHKLYRYVKYRNPKSPHSWKRKRGVGVDMVLKVEDHVFYIEETYLSRKGWFRRHWFKKSRLKRFEGYPHDSHHSWVILTNRPSNFKGIAELVKFHGIKIISINGLLSLIRETIESVRRFSMGLFNPSIGQCNLVNYSLTNSNNNVYAHEKDPVKQDPRIRIDNPAHDQFILDSLDKLKKHERYYEFD